MVNQPAIHSTAIKTQMILMTNQPSPKAKSINVLNVVNGIHELDDAKTHGHALPVVILAYHPKTNLIIHIILGEDVHQSYAKYVNVKVTSTSIACLLLFINNSSLVYKNNVK